MSPSFSHSHPHLHAHTQTCRHHTARAALLPKSPAVPGTYLAMTSPGHSAAAAPALTTPICPAACTPGSLGAMSLPLCLDSRSGSAAGGQRGWTLVGGGGVGGRGELRGKGRRGHWAFVLLLDQPWEGEKGGAGSRCRIDCATLGSMCPDWG